MSTGSTKQAPSKSVNKFLLSAKTFVHFFDKKKIPGFLLIEACIFLLILGLVGTVSLHTFKTIQKQQMLHKTESHMEAALGLLASFLTRAKYIPTPARLGHTNDGYETEACGTLGLIPFKTIGLQESDAKDGLGNWIQYQVAVPLCMKNRYAHIQSLYGEKRTRPEGRIFCDEKTRGLEDNGSNYPVVIMLTSPIGITRKISMEQFLVQYAKVICNHP